MAAKGATRPSLIRNASWAIVWDRDRGHAYRTDVDVRLADGQIAEIAPGGTLSAAPGDSCTRGPRFPADAGSRRHPLPSLDRAVVPRAARGPRGPGAVHDGAARALAGLPPRQRGTQGSDRDGLCRDAGRRRHHGSGPVRAVHGLDRRDARERAARLRCCRLRFRALGHVLPGRRHLGVGRGGGPQGVRAGQEHPRRGRGRCFGPAQGRRVPAADRHGQRGAVSRVVRVRRGNRPPVHEPPGADGGGGARDDPPSRHHAGRMGGEDRHPRPAHHHGALHLPRRAPADRLAHEARPRHPGRDRHDGGALPDAFRPLRRCARLFRPLPRRGRQHGARHRRRAAQPDRGDAHGDPRRTICEPATSAPPIRAPCSMPRRLRAHAHFCATISAASPSAPRPIWRSWISTIR